MARRDRMAVRDADPKRAAKIAEAEAKAERRVAAQEARGVAEAEDALLRNRGLEAELELSPSTLSPDEERSLLSPTSAAALRDRRRVEAAFASRPRLSARAAEAAPREDADARAEVGGETTPALDRADSGAQAELMEALMAEARRDAEAEAEAEAKLAEAKLAEAKKAEAKLAASVERGTSAKLVDAFDVDPVAASPARRRPRPGHPGAADASFAASLAASVAASVAASGGFEWPPPAPASERQAERDAALERRVRAKMRSFLYYSEKEGGPGRRRARGAARGRDPH